MVFAVWKYVKYETFRKNKHDPFFTVLPNMYFEHFDNNMKYKFTVQKFNLLKIKTYVLCFFLLISSAKFTYGDTFNSTFLNVCTV